MPWSAARGAEPAVTARPLSGGAPEQAKRPVRQASQSQRWESNPQPQHYECCALPVELRWQVLTDLWVPKTPLPEGRGVERTRETALQLPLAHARARRKHAHGNLMRWVSVRQTGKSDKPAEPPAPRRDVAPSSHSEGGRSVRSGAAFCGLGSVTGGFPAPATCRRCSRPSDAPEVPRRRGPRTLGSCVSLAGGA
jgi:hypothetical protein